MDQVPTSPGYLHQEPVTCLAVWHQRQDISSPSNPRDTMILGILGRYHHHWNTLRSSVGRTSRRRAGYHLFLAVVTVCLVLWSTRLRRSRSSPCEVNTPKTRILKPTILLEAQAVLLPGKAPSPAQVDSRCAFNRSYTRMSEPVSTPFTTRAQQPGADIPPSCSPSPEIRSTKASFTPSTNAPEPRFS